MIKPMVLILCTGNSCRSQMAEGFLRHYQGDEFDAHSAGTDPAARVHPLAVQVMDEVGIDISAQRPKALKDYLGKQPVRHVLVVCDRAGETCPRIWPGTWSIRQMPFEDPAEATGTDEEVLAVFRRVRDEIAQAMQAWHPDTAEAMRAFRDQHRRHDDDTHTKPQANTQASTPADA
ncbi:MAG: arsenate reductase ArsC [Phycisphaerae bacterium]